LLGVCLAISACAYPGSGGVYDYGMAASTAWVVATGINFICRYRTWSACANGSCGASADNFCASPAILACGSAGLTDGATVAYDGASDRFYYAGLLGGVCLSSAPAADPLAIDRAYFFTADQLQLPGLTDQPHIMVSDNKVAIVTNGSRFNDGRNFHSTTLVVRKQDILDNVGAHTAVVVHANVVTPSVTVGGGGALAWAQANGSSLTVGLITGVPGENGGINTTSAAMNMAGSASFSVANTPTPGGSVSAGDHPVLATSNVVLNFGAGNGQLWTTTRIDNKRGHFLEADRIRNLIPTFNPDIFDQRIIALPPGGSEFLCESLGVTPSGNALIGFASAGAGLNLSPWIVVWPNLGLVQTNPLQIDASQQVASSGFERLDFCPTGAAFPDALNPPQWYAGVGLRGDVVGSATTGWEDGMEALYFRDNQF
jgi:hypothetical protein